MTQSLHSLNPLKIMIIAGEPSGDLLAAGLMAALKQQRPDVLFEGIGGPHMLGAGLEKSLFPMEELSHMGLLEVLPHIPTLVRRMRQTVRYGRTLKPDILITVDSPDFTLRVAKKMKATTGCTCIHYVSPSVWAWRRGRVKAMAKFLDHILLLFPFETAIYKAAGLFATYVGHPVVERTAALSLASSPASTRLTHENLTLALLPGSREGVINRLLPDMLGAYRLLKQSHPTLKAMIPVSSETRLQQMRTMVAGTPDMTFVTDTPLEHLQTCTAAVAASGTSNLELAMLKIPMLVTYKMNRLTHFIAQRIIEVPYASPVNWVFDGGRGHATAVPELIQQACTPENISEALRPLLEPDSAERKAQLHCLEKVRTSLQTSAPASHIAADAVLRSVQL